MLFRSSCSWLESLLVSTRVDLIFSSGGSMASAPKTRKKGVSPVARLAIVENLGLNSLHYLVVRTFDCPIALGVGNGSVTQLGTQLVAKFLKFCTRKLLTIICDYSTGDSKPSNHASHHEPFCYFLYLGLLRPGVSIS